MLKIWCLGFGFFLGVCKNVVEMNCERASLLYIFVRGGLMNCDVVQVCLASCELQDNEACFHAIQQAAGAKLVLSSCILLHTGELWFDSKRPGMIEERDGLGQVPSITISSDAVASSSSIALAGVKRPRQQFHPGVDDDWG